MKIRKLLFLLLIIVSVFVVSGCGKKETPELPSTPLKILPNGTSNYMTVKKDGVSYSVSVDEMYVKLRNDVGFASVIEWADKTIVKSFSKRDLYKKLSSGTSDFSDIDDTPYWDLVTEDEIINDMIVAYFKGDVGSQTREELINILKTTYLEEVYNQGYRTFDDLLDFFHLRRAKYKCVADYYEIYKQADPYTEGQKKTFYKENYFNDFSMILLPFNSYNEAEGTLKQLGFTISAKNVEEENDYDKWIVTATQKEATANEVAKAFIDLYNGTMFKKIDAQTVSKLEEGKQYSVVNGNIVFNTEEYPEVFDYSGRDLNSISADLYSSINSMSTYTNQTGTTWYSPRIRTINDNVYLILNIDKDLCQTYEEVKDNLPAQMRSSDLTDDEVGIQMAYIRYLNELVIYDGSIKYSYNNTFGYKVTEDAIYHDTYVAVLDIEDKNGSRLNSQYTKEAMFKDMDYAYGPYISSEIVNYYNFLYDSKYNNVFDLTMDTINDKDRILNKVTWDFMVSDVEAEKKTFLNDEYYMYGYPASYGWENFMAEQYGVLSERDLALLYLRRSLMQEYIDSTSDLKGVSEDSQLWKYFKESMKDIADSYYKVDANTITLTYAGSNGVNSSPETWTTEQKALIEEFYKEILKILEADPEKLVESLEAITYAYNNAPYLLGDLQDANSVYLGVNMSKYKTAGIKLYNTDLETFVNGANGISIDKVAKEIWDLDPTSETPVLYGTSKNPKYIVNSEGYIVYVNEKCFDMTRLDDTGRNVPTLQEIQLYIADPTSDAITMELFTVIGDIYTPLSAELGTVYYIARDLYKAQANYEIIFSKANFTINEYQKVLQMSIAEAESNLNYTK